VTEALYLILVTVSVAGSVFSDGPRVGAPPPGRYVTVRAGERAHALGGADIMCRWMAYSGNSVPLETLLFDVESSLIDQSMSSRSETPTNGDGFGVGWYGSRRRPGLFRSIRPAWNDFNLRNIAAQVDSHLFLAHVRAASLAAV
jgi:hypothetical protein